MISVFTRSQVNRCYTYNRCNFIPLFMEQSTRKQSSSLKLRCSHQKARIGILHASTCLLFIIYAKLRCYRAIDAYYLWRTSRNCWHSIFFTASINHHIGKYNWLWRSTYNYTCDDDFHLSSVCHCQINKSLSNALNIFQPTIIR